MRNKTIIKAELAYINKNFVNIAECSRNEKGDTSTAYEALELLRQQLILELLGISE